MLSKVYPVCKDLTEAVGLTPLIAVDRLRRKFSVRPQVLVKCEFMNPTGSIKDRMAIQVIADAERSGRLKKGDTAIVLTSGNGGISLAAVCAAKGYKLIVTMSEGNSAERRTIIKALGAELVLVPQVPGSVPGQVSHEDLDAVDKKTAELTKKYRAFRIDQFADDSNPRGHEKTGHEIWEGTAGKVTAFVAFVGSSGCFTGISRALKLHDRKVKSFAVEPATAPYLAKGKITNISHKIQGGGYAQPLPLFDENVCDGFISVTEDEAISVARETARLEGLFVGFSSGANISASLKLAEGLDENDVIVTVLPDSGMKYLSTNLFE